MLIGRFVTFRKRVWYLLMFRLSSDPPYFRPIHPFASPTIFLQALFLASRCTSYLFSLFLLHLFSLVAPPFPPPHSFIFPPLICSIFFLFYNFPYLDFLSAPLCSSSLHLPLTFQPNSIKYTICRVSLVACLCPHFKLGTN